MNIMQHHLTIHRLIQCMIKLNSRPSMSLTFSVVNTKLILAINHVIESPIFYHTCSTIDIKIKSCTYTVIVIVIIVIVMTKWISQFIKKLYVALINDLSNLL